MSEHSDRDFVNSPAPEGATATAPPPPPPPPTAPAAATPRPESHGGGRATFGVVLIVVGALLLAGRFFTLANWLCYWPLVIVLAGLVQAFTPGREGWSVPKMFDGFVTVAFGGVLLAITLGYVGWNVWGRILALWPVLLIAVGFEILAKALHATWLKVVGSLAVIVALAYAVSTSVGGTDQFVFFGGAPSGEQVAISEPVGLAQEAKLTLDGGVANIDIEGGGDLIAIAGVSPWGSPRVEVNRTGSSADVKATLGEPEGSAVWPGGPSAKFDVALSDAVVWDVRMNVGVAAVKADLADIPVRTLDLRPGVADCEVRLGEVPNGVSEARADVRSGISSVTLRLPADAEARVQVESGLSGTNVRGGFSETGRGVWESAGYAGARASGAPVWNIVVRSGIGSILIDTY